MCGFAFRLYKFTSKMVKKLRFLAQIYLYILLNFNDTPIRDIFVIYNGIFLMIVQIRIWLDFNFDFVMPRLGDRMGHAISRSSNECSTGDHSRTKTQTGIGMKLHLRLCTPNSASYPNYWPISC